ncbi:MAG: DEAD/DEAH box helicase [Gammaproteobacteria bacterium]|nr:DEAD/DEAH box helicase [Gammaproteobacteria bacterium]
MDTSQLQFHPATTRWFTQHFADASEVQRLAWASIARGEATLLAAPTGSGKTLAAFLAIIDQLIQEGLQFGLPDETRVLYVSPLKALSNDVQKNLQQPLNGIRDELLHAGLPDVPINAWVRTGDTSQAERERMRRQAPHIIVTTPESLYLLLSSVSGRQMLGSVRSVIVDEIHALAGNKRGAHLSLSLERLDQLCRQQQGRAPVRIGISATQKPIADMAHFLMGARDTPVNIIDTGHVRARDLAIELPPSPIEAVMANEVWDELYTRLEQLITAHDTTLIFVNTRRLAERVAHHLAERLGEDAVTSHHGSLSRKHRLRAEQQLKQGQLRALVATASLELGIDIGNVDLVCQLGSPRAIASFLQRVGRSGHRLNATPKGRLFPLSHNDLVECVALFDAVQRDELDHIRIPAQPLDVLAQQIVAEVASQDWRGKDLYKAFKHAWPYRDLDEQTFTDVVRMLSEGYSTRRGRRGAYLHRDIVNDQLRARRGARLVALTNGGAIPDQFDYDVVLQPEGSHVGSLNEDFAFESLPGDIFQLGNTSYRIQKIEQGKVYVEDAHGQPPNIPFWFGEAPGRSDELSAAVSRLLQAMETRLDDGQDATQQWLQQAYGLDHAAASQLTTYLLSAKAALGCLPNQGHIVFERFFDEAGDMHLVIHSPFGSRLNRAWGLALRKRFCRQFNFELQAAATDNSIVLSLGPTHSFPLEEVVHYLNKNTVRKVLIQALLDAPMFGTRWRWNTNISLAVPRNRNGKRIPAQFQRSDAEDLVALVFPDQLACLENIRGEREIPKHPLVQQTLHDCLYDNMDIEGLEQLYQRIDNGEVRITCRDLAGPSPLCGEILTARPYAFLDDGAAEERRTLNVKQTRYADPQAASELGQLNPEAIALVKQEAWPEARSADELYDAMVLLGFVTDKEITPDWRNYLRELTQQQRVTTIIVPQQTLHVSAERLQEIVTLYEIAPATLTIPLIELHADIDPDTALVNLLRSRLEGLGPVSESELSEQFGLPLTRIQQALLQLEQQGFALRGQFTHHIETQWCERRLLARIHRYTLQDLRKQIRPVSPQDYMRFLFQWQHLSAPVAGTESLYALLEQLEGVTLPAICWERDILPARMQLYLPQYLDQLCNTGRVHWQRLSAPANKLRAQAGVLRHTAVAVLPRRHRDHWQTELTAQPELNAHAEQVKTLLQQHGASFFDELLQASGLLPVQLETALAELASNGILTSDNFAGLRALITPQRRHRHRQRRRSHSLLDEAGRWSLIKPNVTSETRESTEHIARVLLQRYGVVFRKVLEREPNLPPWRELLYVYRRLEARGEIRGGRFVSGFSGEQFALNEAITPLRQMRDAPPEKQLRIISAVDPLNLCGIITPGERIPAKHTIQIIYQDGIPVAFSHHGKLQTLKDLSEAQIFNATQLLHRPHRPLATIAQNAVH